MTAEEARIMAEAAHATAQAAAQRWRLECERQEGLRQLVERAADRLALEVDKLVRARTLDARSPAADALLDYVQSTGDATYPDLEAFRARAHRRANGVRDA